MGSIFISYRSVDREFVLRLADDITKAGGEVWIDTHQITGRKPYWNEIQDAVEKCSHFLFVISPDSIAEDSGALTELYHAAGLKPVPTIVPIVVRTVLFKSLPIYLTGRYQIHDFAQQPYTVALGRLLLALGLQQNLIQPAVINEKPVARRSNLARIAIPVVALILLGGLMIIITKFNQSLNATIVSTLRATVTTIALPTTTLSPEVIQTPTNTSTQSYPIDSISHPPIPTISYALPISTQGVIYAINDDDDLLWFRHVGWEDGSRVWATSVGKKVASGWKYQQVFSGGNGVIYAVTEDGTLIKFLNKGESDGSPNWESSSGVMIGVAFDFKQMFSCGNSIIYGINDINELFWFRDYGGDASNVNWANNYTIIASGWNFKQVFCTGNGVIYAITDSGDLLWFRHDGWRDGSSNWATDTGIKLGERWNFKQVFSIGLGVIYGITNNGDLSWFRHTGWEDGSDEWLASDVTVASGWSYKQVFSTWTIPTSLQPS